MSRSTFGRGGLLVSLLIGLLSFGCASAMAAGPPVVTVGETTGHTLHTAVANGTVNLNGASSGSYKFEYGKTELYGKSTIAKNLTGSGALPVSQIIFGLESPSTYHVRISATNKYGTTVSEDMTFAMLLQWKVNGKPLSAYPEGVQYGTEFPTSTLTVIGTKWGPPFEVSCKTDNSQQGYGTGWLGVNYHLPYTSCKTYLNGVESKVCEPVVPLVVDLNSVMVPVAGTAIKLGEECTLAEEIPLTGGGFELGAMSAEKRQAITLTEHLPIFGGITVTASNMKWGVVGALNDSPFEIS